MALKDMDFLLTVVGVYVLEAVGSWGGAVGLLTPCWLFQQSGRKYNLFLKRRLRVKQRSCKWLGCCSNNMLHCVLPSVNWEQGSQ